MNTHMNNTNKLTYSPFSTTNPSIHFVSLSLHKTLRTSGQKPYPFIKNFTQSTLNNWANKPTSPYLPTPSYWSNKPIPPSPLTLNNWMNKLTYPSLPTPNYWSNKLIPPCPLVLSDWPKRPIVSKDVLKRFL